MKISTTTTIEVWYTWKELATPKGENKSRLITPWADPMLYESEFNYYFASEKEALDSKAYLAPDEDWVLVKMTLEPMYLMCYDEDDGEKD